MAASRSVLRLTSLTVQRVQSRGMAAIKNWKRPSMDEIAVPSEPWAQVIKIHSRSKYHTSLYSNGGNANAMTNKLCCSPMVEAVQFRNVLFSSHGLYTRYFNI